MGWWIGKVGHWPKGCIRYANVSYSLGDVRLRWVDEDASVVSVVKARLKTMKSSNSLLVTEKKKFLNSRFSPPGIGGFCDSNLPSQVLNDFKELTRLSGGLYQQLVKLVRLRLPLCGVCLTSLRCLTSPYDLHYHIPVGTEKSASCGDEGTVGGRDPAPLAGGVDVFLLVWVRLLLLDVFLPR